MKLMLFGRNGRLGKTFTKLHKINFSYSHDEIDISNRDKIFEIIEKNRPDIIINCAALTDIDFCEKNQEKTWNTNVYGVKNLADAAKKYDSYLIHFSSDAAKNPNNTYGKTKLVSEGLVNDLVIRLTVYNKDDWLLKALLNNREVTLTKEIILNPISTVNTCEIALKLANLKHKGIINIGTKNKINMYEFGNHIAETYNITKSLIKHSNNINQGTVRNNDRYLDTEELEKLGIQIPTIKEDLQRYKEKDI